MMNGVGGSSSAETTGLTAPRPVEVNQSANMGCIVAGAPCRADGGVVRRSFARQSDRSLDRRGEPRIRGYVVTAIEPLANYSPAPSHPPHKSALKLGLEYCPAAIGAELVKFRRAI